MNIVDLALVPHHIEQLAAWHQREWGYLNPGMSLAQRIEKLKQALDTGFPYMAVATAGERLLGSAALVECDMDTHPEWYPWLASVFVDPAHRGEGIGDALVNHIETLARSLGHPHLHLFTPDASGFYRKRGWKIIAEEPYRDTAVTTMVIDLDPVQ